MTENPDIKQNVELAPYTTWKVGGPAEYFTEVATRQELIAAVAYAQEHDLPVTVLGWGSNVLIADRGINGLVIRNRSNSIELGDDCKFTPRLEPFVRLQQVDTQNYYSFSEIDYREETDKGQLVWVDSGVGMGLAINKLISEGLTGLQWFSGIPGTLGGAVYNNIHGGSHFISEYIHAVEVLSQGDITTLTADQLEFDYDYSRFHKTQEIILRVQLCLPKGDKDRARNASIEWARKKKLQPSNSAGCCYQNLLPEQVADLGLDSNSWGYIIDKVLNLKGVQSGNAQISPEHAAFIETTPGAKAADVFSLLKLVSDTAKDKLGLRPRLEIFFLGFTAEELSQLED